MGKQFFQLKEERRTKVVVVGVVVVVAVLQEFHFREKIGFVAFTIGGAKPESLFFQECFH